MVKEIKSKQLYKELAKRGHADVTLFKDSDAGAFYFIAGEYISNTICIYAFNHQTPAQWAEMICNELNKYKDAREMEAFELAAVEEIMKSIYGNGK